MDTVLGRLDDADAKLTNFEDCETVAPDSEAFTSAVDAARSAINAARALVMEKPSE